MAVTVIVLLRQGLNVNQGITTGETIAMIFVVMEGVQATMLAMMEITLTLMVVLPLANQKPDGNALGVITILRIPAEKFVEMELIWSKSNVMMEIY